jgi:hemerythrin-like domain-containing protein
VTNTENEAVAVIETKLAHDFHRRATAVLVEAAERPSVPAEALAELREFLVRNLHHHHETEDDQLWPLLLDAAPELTDGLTELSKEHDQLDAALDALDAAPVEDRAALREKAVAVRDLVLRHLEREEPLMFPVLRNELAPEAWAKFSQEVVASSPTVAPHLLIGFLDEVGTPEDVALVLSGLPEPARELVPVLREQGKSALAGLSGK